MDIFDKKYISQSWNLIQDIIPNDASVLFVNPSSIAMCQDLILTKKISGTIIDSGLYVQQMPQLNKSIQYIRGSIHTTNNIRSDSFSHVVIDYSLCMQDKMEDQINAALTYGQYAVFGIINGGFWKRRLNYLKHGTMYQKNFYDYNLSRIITPNYFLELCLKANLNIERTGWVDLSGRISSWHNPYLFPTIFAERAFFLINRDNTEKLYNLAV